MRRPDRKILAGALAVLAAACLIAALALLAGILYLLFRPYQESTRLTTKVRV